VEFGVLVNSGSLSKHSLMVRRQLAVGPASYIQGQGLRRPVPDEAEVALETFQRADEAQDLFGVSHDIVQEILQDKQLRLVVVVEL
jgi:hypothetical protein